MGEIITGNLEHYGITTRKWQGTEFWLINIV